MDILQTHVAQERPTRTRTERALIEAQNAVQWLARVTRSYAPAATGDVPLFFDPATRHVITPEVAPGIRLRLHLPTLVLQFEENGKPTPHALDVDDKSTTEIEAWLLAELLHRGFDRDRFDKRLPYEWPHPMSGDEMKYTAHELADQLNHLAEQLATAVTGSMRAKHFAQEAADPEPRDRALVPVSPDLSSMRVSI